MGGSSLHLEWLHQKVRASGHRKRKPPSQLQLSAISTIGPSGILTLYIGALRFYKHGREMAQEGYERVSMQSYVLGKLYTTILPQVSLQNSDADTGDRPVNPSQ